MGREVRMVPPEWKHPKNERGFIPLLDGSFEADDREWDKGWRKWQEGYRENYGDGPKWVEHDGGTFTEWHGSRPSPDDYMPEWTEDEATHLMMYETVSEGTPISPAFATPEELAKWLTDNNASAFGGHGASYDGWLRVAKGGFAPSLVMGGGVMVSGVDGLPREDT
jgi:hypothetical protein